MFNEITVRLLAAPFAFGAILTILFGVRRRARRRAVPSELVIHRKPSLAVEVAWTAVQILTPALFLLPPFVPRMTYANLLSVNLPYSDILQIAGYALMVVGAVLLYLAQKALGRFLMRDIGVTTKHELITDGPYGRIRHPLYTATLLLNSGLALFYLNALPAVNFLIAIFGAYNRAKLEEEMLASEKAFGSKYLEYVSRTGMFLPRLRGQTD